MHRVCFLTNSDLDAAASNLDWRRYDLTELQFNLPEVRPPHLHFLSPWQKKRKTTLTFSAVKHGGAETADGVLGEERPSQGKKEKGVGKGRRRGRVRRGGGGRGGEGRLTKRRRRREF